MLAGGSLRGECARRVWQGYDVLARGATRFSGKAAACSGDAFTTTDPAAVARARQLPRVMLLNRRHGPGQLAVFVQRAPHLDGASLTTFAVSGDQRSIEAMTHALLPARDADEARTRLLAAIDGAGAAPEWMRPSMSCTGTSACLCPASAAQPPGRPGPCGRLPTISAATGPRT